MDVEMKIRGLMVDPSTNMPVVILKDPKSEAMLEPRATDYGELWP